MTEILDIKDKVVWIKYQGEFDKATHKQLQELSEKFKKEGAKSVLITDQRFDFKLLNDEQLLQLGLRKI